MHNHLMTYEYEYTVSEGTGLFGHDDTNVHVYKKPRAASAPKTCVPQPRMTVCNHRGP